MLADTSVWIDHFRHSSPRLEALLEKGQVRTHPFIVGELACGNLGKRVEVLRLLRELPPVVSATDDEASARPRLSADRT